jgi:competence protein ComEC
MRKILWLARIAGLVLLTQGERDSAQTRATLDIYVVDVEGGNATLFIALSGESLLIETGNVAPDAAIRDCERIMAPQRMPG